MKHWTLLLLFSGCTANSNAAPDASVDAAIDAKPSLDGTWSLTRALAQAEPQPPRTEPCPPFTTGSQPSSMTIIGTTIGTDFGMPLEHVMFGGTHDLAFDSTEGWNTVGANIPVTLHYALDITSSTSILGQATATAAWPTGSCAYTYNISSHLQTQ